MSLLMLCLSLARAASLDSLMREELDRAWNALQQESDPPYYASLQVTDSHTLIIAAEAGMVRVSDHGRSRVMDTDVRTGSPDLDNTHPLRGVWDRSSVRAEELPLDDNADRAVRHAIWRGLDRAARDARNGIVVVRSNQIVRAEEEDPSPDFELRAGIQHGDAALPALPELDREAWSDTLAELSLQLDGQEAVLSSGASLEVTSTVRTFVDSAGGRITEPMTRLRVTLFLSTRTPDGDEVEVYRYRVAQDPAGLPDPATLRVWADEALLELAGRAAAPRGEPFSGPVLLTGRAAGVFFHEVLGHRLEGQRQKRDDEGKTFADMVGDQILPDGFHVYDDPSIQTMAGEDLNGYYQFDDEGVPGQRADLVRDGVLVGFLQYRSPIRGFSQSNGHGRRSPGNRTEARMANLIITADNALPDAALRAKLLAEIRSQKLPYGLMVDDIGGGFTMTGRIMPNAFNVRVESAWRIYADGRPDERVRGVDLVGTPLVAFENLLAAGQTSGVFNGVCGSDSGWVPVSAVSPSLLFRTLEIQRKEKGSERPPLLPKPVPADDNTVGVLR